MVGIERLSSDEDIARLRLLLEWHINDTTSPYAQRIMANWEESQGYFWKVVPHPEKAPAPKEKAARPDRPARGDRPTRPNRDVSANGTSDGAADNKTESDGKPDQPIAIKSPEEQATSPADENQPAQIPAS
jgi:glutamate synthase domain-containing protein 3